MPLRIEEKQQKVVEIQEKLTVAKVAIFADYKGLNVAEATELRRRFRAEGIEYRVIKNNLVKIAADNCGLEGIKELLVGQTAIAYGFGDPVVPAKVLMSFIKEKHKIEVKGGLLEGNVIDGEGVKALAALPAKEVLISQVMGSMQAPLTSFMYVLKGPAQKFVYALRAIAEKKAG